MRAPKLKLAVIAVAAAFAGDAAAIDFLQTYRLARQNDPTFAGARASLEAGLEKLPQGRSLLLPVINGTANTTWNSVDNKLLNETLNFNSNGWAVTLTQPIFRWQNLVQYKQSEFQVLQSEAQFSQATMDLIVRVAQAYFDVLAAQDNLEFTIANKIAIAEQLAQAKRNFEVGTATITDTNEAQARYDLAVAQEISGQNALEVAIRALQQIIGDIPDKLTPLKAVAMTTPTPNVMDDWAKAARANNMVVRGNEAVFEIATREIERQRAGHYPTLDVVTSYTDTKTVNPNVLGPKNTINQGAIGLQLAVPLFAGGSVSSRTREAVALREKARQDLEASKRAAEFNARQSYLNVTNGLAQVKALEQALVSSETALQSNRVGYEVGVRINIDVLNAQQQVFQTKRDLARARYDTILNGLRLKSAAGSLTENDVDLVNTLLGFDTSAPGGPMIDTPQKPPSDKPATGTIDAPRTAAAVTGAKAAEAAAEKSPAQDATRAKRASAQGQKEKTAAPGKAAAPAKTVAAEKTAATENTAPAGKAAATRAEPTPPANEPAAAVTTPVAPTLATSVVAPATAPVAAPVTTSENAPVAAGPTPAGEAIGTPAAAEKSAAAPTPEAIGTAASADETRPMEATVVPVAMQPAPTLEKQVPAAEALAPGPAPKPAATKESAKTAAKSAAPKAKKPERDASAAATQALADEVARATPLAPAEQTANERAPRVYLVVEPQIPPGSAPIAGDPAPATASPAPDPKPD